MWSPAPSQRPGAFLVSRLAILDVASIAATCLALALLALFAPAALAADTLVVANKTANSVDLFDAKTGVSRATVATGYRPHEVVVSPDGSLAVVSNYGDREKPGASLTVVDLRTAKVARTIELAATTQPHGLAWLAGNEIVVTAEGTKRLLVVDAAKGVIVREIETAQEISHMVVVSSDKKRAFVTNIGSGSVSVLDLVAGTKIRDIRTGAGAEGIAMSPDGNELWVGNRANDTIAIIDPEALEVRAMVACEGFPIRIAFTPDGKRVIVAAAKSGEVVLFDAKLRKEIARRKFNLATATDAAQRLFGDRFGASTVPVGIVVAPKGDRAWVAATKADMVVVVDTKTLRVTELVRAGKEPDGMALARGL
ncbi:MAG: beta-propeller fold lactonase family protein [Acidobacteria bacterium]|nr:beta-propeller fold lactonase family protein [Acidobacteriota bacterium]